MIPDSVKIHLDNLCRNEDTRTHTIASMLAAGVARSVIEVVFDPKEVDHAAALLCAAFDREAVAARGRAERGL